MPHHLLQVILVTHPQLDEAHLHIASIYYIWINSMRAKRLTVWIWLCFCLYEVTGYLHHSWSSIIAGYCVSSSAWKEDTYRTWSRIGKVYMPAFFHNHGHAQRFIQRGGEGSGIPPPRMVDKIVHKMLATYKVEFAQELLLRLMHYIYYIHTGIIAYIANMSI